MKKTLLWVDPNRNSSNDRIERDCRRSNIQVLRCSTTEEGLLRFRELGPDIHGVPQTHFRVLTNMVRPAEPGGGGDPTTPNYEAGKGLADQLHRVCHYTGPVLIFAGSLPHALRTVGDHAPLVRVTNSEEEACAYALFHDDAMWNPAAMGYTAARCGGVRDSNSTTDPDAQHPLAPDVARLLAEGVERRELTTAAVLAMPDGQSCIRSLPPGETVQFIKYYITRELGGSPVGQTLCCRLWRAMESLLYRYAEPAQLPRLKRILVVENSFLRRRFNAALQQLETQGASAGAPLAWPPRAEGLPTDWLRQLELAVTDTGYVHARPTLLFHCTRDTAETGICCNGFSLAKLGQGTGNDGWYGRGIYFTSYASYAAWYRRTRTSKHAQGNLCITVSWVLVGRPHLIEKIEIGRAPEPGCVSHYAVVHDTRPIAEKPPGTAPNGDEVVVFDEAHALPQFVLELDGADSVAGSP